MNDITSAEFSPPRNATAGGDPWERTSKAVEHAPGPAPAEAARLPLPCGLMGLTGRRPATAEPLAVYGDAANGYG